VGSALILILLFLSLWEGLGEGYKPVTSFTE
jgi:hypothetical protein